jgi:hypothetical protein
MQKRDKESDHIEKADQKISRKEAIKKAGYAAFSAATMMLLLNDPARAQTTSDDDTVPADPGPWDPGEWG